MVDRITITVPIYMPLDGQWQIVYPGSVVDVPNKGSFSTNNISVASDAAGSLASHGKPTPVRNIRTGF